MRKSAALESAGFATTGLGDARRGVDAAGPVQDVQLNSVTAAASTTKVLKPSPILKGR